MNFLPYLLTNIACLFPVDISQGTHKVAYHSECPLGNSAYKNKERQTQMQI